MKQDLHQEDEDFSRDWEESVASWIKKVKFRKRLFGGVSESDVFQKIAELNEMYRKALLAERARYEALLDLRQEKGGGSD